MKHLQLLIFCLFYFPLLAISCPENQSNDEVYVEPEKRGYSTTLDFMDKTKYVIETEYSSTKLRKIPDGYDGSYVYGVYSYALYILSLYPNSEYTIKTTCDICGDGELLEYGTWSYANSKVNLKSDYKNINPGFLSLEFLTENIGSYETINFFVTEKGNNIGDALLITDKKLKEIVDKKSVFKYLTKTNDFIDWEFILEKTKKMKE